MTFQISTYLTPNLKQRGRGLLRRSAAIVALCTYLLIPTALKFPAQTAQTVAQKALQSVVMLTMDDPQGKRTILGSGFLIREGVVATNLHVVQDSIKGSAKVVGTKDEFEVAGIIADDREHDLALVSVPAISAPSLTIGDSTRLAVGDEVYVVGNPRGLEGTFSQGIVSALREVDSKILIQITAPISPGSSGGPVLNSRGEVVGVAEATVKGGQNLNFAVPASYLAPLLVSIKGVTPLFAVGRRIERPTIPQKTPQPKLQSPGEQSKGSSHFQRCQEFSDAEKFDEAEPECRAAIAEYRAALHLNPNNALAHHNLGLALWSHGDLDGAAKEFGEAVRLNPEDWLALQLLDLWYNAKRDWDGEISELREVLRLHPKSSSAHSLLGVALGNKGDWDGDVTEQRVALRLNPNDVEAHINLGMALGGNGDSDGYVAEEREAVRLNPRNMRAHYNLGLALGGKGDSDGAIAEYREALHLWPDDVAAHCDLGKALGNKGDGEGAVTEFREALRLNPNNDEAHWGLGVGLRVKGDFEGAIAEERKALRLNPDNDDAHYDLGVALELKGDSQGALQEYRTAYELDTKNDAHRQAYERIVKQINQ